MPSLESNKQVIRQYVAAFNKGDTAKLRELFTPDAVIYGVLGAAGIEEALKTWAELHSAFGVTLTAEEIVAEGERVAVRYTEKGKFVGPFRGKKPTGKPYEMLAMEWFVMRDGRIHRRWGARDSASQSRQIGT